VNGNVLANLARGAITLKAKQEFAAKRRLKGSTSKLSGASEVVMRTKSLCGAARLLMYFLQQATDGVFVDDRLRLDSVERVDWPVMNNRHSVHSVLSSLNHKKLFAMTHPLGRLREVAESHSIATDHGLRSPICSDN
jgi:hypothetical protein